MAVLPSALRRFPGFTSATRDIDADIRELEAELFKSGRGEAQRALNSGTSLRRQDAVLIATYLRARSRGRLALGAAVIPTAVLLFALGIAFSDGNRMPPKGRLGAVLGVLSGLLLAGPIRDRSVARFLLKETRDPPEIGQPDQPDSDS